MAPLLFWMIWSCLSAAVVADLHPLPVTVDPAFSKTLGVASPTVILACQATRYPDTCSSALAADARSATASSLELTRIAVDLSASGTSQDLTSIRQMVDAEALDINATAAAQVCSESLDYASSTLITARDSLLLSPIEDIQAWVSSALQNQYDCFSGLSNVPTPPTDLATIVLPHVNSTMQLISIALNMANALAYYGSDATTWVPPPEVRPADISTILKTTNPEWLSQSNGCSSTIPIDFSRPDVTVAQDGTGMFSSIQQAVDNAPSYGTVVYIIYIKAGVYNEIVRVHKDKTMLMFVGDGDNQTVITGSRNALQPGVVTYQTATVVVVGNRFVARGITFQNTAGAEMRQAVAVRVDSDLSAFYDCIFDGYQDTLYAHTGRQFYKSCTIRGTVDFVFGNSAAVFQDCQLLVRLRMNPTSVMTAQGRTDPGQTTGLVFQNCTLSGTPDYMQALLENPAGHQAFLGRPWKLFSRTIYVNSFLDSVIQPEGWLAWDGEFALSSLFYGECGTSGPGANAVSRVVWSSQLSLDQAAFFSVDNFVQGSRWLPCTSVPYS